MHDSTDSDSETATTISDTTSEYDSSDSKFYKTKLCAKFEVSLASVHINTKRHYELYTEFCKFFVSSPSLPWQHGTWQQGLCISVTTDEMTVYNPHCSVRFVSE